MERTSYSNIPDSINKKISLNIFKQQDHPIQIICTILKKYFKEKNFVIYEDLSKVVHVKNNFDDLLIPTSHCTRNKTDTYYQNENYVLRTHMTAHSVELLKIHDSFITIGDVYRKDEIDKNHYPIFHQLDGVIKVSKETNSTDLLKETLSNLVEYLFPNCTYRFNADYFPFTEPSFEVEVFYNGKWLEILGCGIFHKKITMDENNEYIAFGLGIDRLAMIFFEIPDIRLFWSSEKKFLTQFKFEDKPINTYNKFVPFSKIDSIYKDVSFWLKEEDLEISNNPEFTWKNANSFYELAREMFVDNIEKVELIDKFYNNKKNTYSNTFRLTFSPNVEISNPSEFNSEINKKMEDFCKILYTKVNVILR